MALELFLVSARTNKRHHHHRNTVTRDSPAREPSWSALWLQKPSILRACVREEDAGGERRARLVGSGAWIFLVAPSFLLCINVQLADAS